MSAAQPVAQGIDAVCDTSNVLWQLWERAEPNLNNSELEWFAKATEQAHNEALSLRDVVSGIACLISSDSQSGALQDTHGTPAMLFSISAQLDTIAGMIEVGSAANNRLRRLELYQRIKDAHGRMHVAT